MLIMKNRKLYLLPTIVLIIFVGATSFSCANAPESSKPPGTNTGSSATPPDTGPPASNTTITAVNLPVEKGKTYKLKSPSMKTGFPFKVEEIKGNWIKTSLANETFWINLNLIETIQE
jgi:hypothetical protein